MEKSKVYFIKEITPENIINAYNAVGKKLEGNVALITGAAAGLGEGIAKVYASYKAKICMN